MWPLVVGFLCLLSDRHSFDSCQRQQAIAAQRCFGDPHMQEPNIPPLFQTMPKAASPLSFLETRHPPGALSDNGWLSEMGILCFLSDFLPDGRMLNPRHRCIDTSAGASQPCSIIVHPAIPACRLLRGSCGAYPVWVLAELRFVRHDRLHSAHR